MPYNTKSRLFLNHARTHIISFSFISFLSLPHYVLSAILIGESLPKRYSHQTFSSYT
jgi:hypothetical protein